MKHTMGSKPQGRAALSDEGAVSRRAILATAAWSTPAIAIAAAVPATAASPTAIELTLQDSVIGHLSSVNVGTTFPSSAVPLNGSVSVSISRLAGTGTILSAAVADGWDFSWGDGTRLTLLPPSNPPLTGNLTSITLSGPSSWLVTLRTSSGSTSRSLEVLPPF